MTIWEEVEDHSYFINRGKWNDCAHACNVSDVSSGTEAEHLKAVQGEESSGDEAEGSDGPPGDVAGLPSSCPRQVVESSEIIERPGS